MCLERNSMYIPKPRFRNGCFPCGSAGKESPAVCETRVQFLCREDALEKEMATHSSILENSGGLQSMGSQRVGPDWVTNFLS